MSFTMSLIVALMTALLAICYGQTNFTGHKLLGAFASNEEELEILQNLTSHPEVDFWNQPTALYEKINIRIPPDSAKDLENQLWSKGIDFYVVTENLQDWIDREREENPPDTALAGRQRNFQLDTYHTFDAISAYIDSVGTRYGRLATVVNLGTTYEGNPIKGLKIGIPGHNKPAAWIDAGIHAREWVAPAAALYIIDHLVTGYDTDSDIKRLVDKFDWYIFPVINPDGYKYTWSYNRMWRKNRSASRSPFQFCRGADPNRNFDSHFGGAGTSGDLCSEIYRGESAFSEAESRAMRDGILRIKDSLKAYFSLHSYSQLWMTPYGHSQSLPQHHAEQLQALQAATTAVQKKHGMWYKHGRIASVLYPATGSSIDWVYDAAKVKYSFALELRDTGRQGFLLQNSLIIPTAEENWDGIKAVMELVGNEVH